MLTGIPDLVFLQYLEKLFKEFPLLALYASMVSLDDRWVNMPSIVILGNSEDFFDHLERLVMDRSAAPHARVHLDVDGRLCIRLLAFF